MVRNTAFKGMLQTLEKKESKPKGLLAYAGSLPEIAFARTPHSMSVVMLYFPENT